MAILTIARLTLREASRRKLLLAVAILTVVLAALTGFAFHKLLALPCGNTGNPHPCSAHTLTLLAATLLILLAFMFSFVLAVGAAFIGAPSVAGDIESGVLLSMLPRPIRRGDVILGKWLGLAALIVLYAGITCGIEFAISAVTLNYVPPHPILAILFLIAEALAVLSLTLAASTRVSAMTVGIVVVVLFGLNWIAGIAGAVGAAFHTHAIQDIGTVSSLLFPTDGLWRATIYNLEPVAVLSAGGAADRVAAGNPFFVLSGPTTAYLIWAICWVIAVLGITMWSFNRREL
jgi:ABC-type transport system involved in multi-copper enzyme maturation permease subunit